MTTVAEDTASITSAREAAAKAKRNLYQRLIAVRLRLGGSIAMGGTADPAMGGYKFIQWDDVADKIGGIMAEEGISWLPSMPVMSEEALTRRSGERERTFYRATVKMELTVVNADDHKERETITWWGQGDDNGDKAVQKAGTSATKYALLKLFQLAGAEDTEAARPEPAAAGNGVAVSPDAALPPARRASGAGAPLFRTILLDDDNNQRKCPLCGRGEVEAVLWESGKVQLACTNWQDCKYRENAPVPLMVAVRKQAEAVGKGVPAPAGRSGELPF